MIQAMLKVAEKTTARKTTPKATKKPATVKNKAVSSLRIVHAKKPVEKKTTTKTLMPKKTKSTIKNSSKIFHNQYIGKKTLHDEAVRKIEQIWRILSEHTKLLKKTTKKPAMKKQPAKVNMRTEMRSMIEKTRAVRPNTRKTDNKKIENKNSTRIEKKTLAKRVMRKA